jgi:aldehyde dehydrogenase (NAD+)
VKGLLAGVFMSNGQTCVAGSRLIVEHAVHDELVARLIDRASQLRFGDPMDPATEIGPIANASQHERILSMIGTAKAQGASTVWGGGVPDDQACGDGWFVEPTIFIGVVPSMRLWREEVFGPVLAVVPFSDEEQALDLANDTDYGLAAGIWTSDGAKAERLVAGIEAGTVYVNHYRSVSPGSPVGGYKRSGYGRELGPDAIYGFLQPKSVWVGSLPMADPFPDHVCEPGG